MKRLKGLKKHLNEGQVYRREDLTQWSKAVDRELNLLVKEGFLEKLSQGLYYVPKKTVFGSAPPDEEALVRTFLKDDDFLLTSWNAYNSLSVGTTQLYNRRVVYNHKRHGEFNLGGRTFFFHAKHRFPRKLTQEFLVVDLVNNVDSLAEDSSQILKNVLAKAQSMPHDKLKSAVLNYGGAKAKALFKSLIKKENTPQHAF